MWPFLTIFAVISAIAIHFAWRRKFLRQQEQIHAEMEDGRRRQQQTTSDAQAQQQVLFNSMLEGLLLLDGKRRIYLANRAFKHLFGLKAELRGKTVMEALRLHELAELVARVETEGQVFDYELKLPELSGRWLRVNAAVISNSAGEREGTILVFHDVTRLKQLERTREDFVANVSHELRTPLSLIKGYVETLLDGARNDPAIAERFLKIIERNTQRLDLLIQDLLTISALESGRMKLNLQPVELRPLAEKIFADLHSRAEMKDVKLVLDLPELTATCGCAPAGAGAREPRGQRHQIWPRAGHGHHRRPARRRMASWKFLCGTTAPASRRGARPRVRAVLPRGQGAVARPGRHRPWSVHRQAHRPEPRWPGLGEKRIRQRRDIFLHTPNNKLKCSTENYESVELKPAK